MAVIIKYTDPNTGAVSSNAYFVISSVELAKSRKNAFVAVTVYADQASRQAKRNALYSELFAFSDPPLGPGGPAPPASALLYSSYFQLPPTSLQVAVNLDDIVMANAYVACTFHPVISLLIAGGTAA
jgi:hypothetical protein